MRLYSDPGTPEYAQLGEWEQSIVKPYQQEMSDMKAQLQKQQEQLQKQQEQIQELQQQLQKRE